ncbi:MAG TPA: BON domain-containing protein [Pyrinomonadaceae bacterium]|nr:BON domain-containing protein [Pyrinomonadaceae bacterium]
MAYDEQEARKSRVVVETPNSRREVTQSEAVRYPERTGISGATVGVIVIVAVALVTILVLFLLSGQSPTDNTNTELLAQQPAPVPQTTIIQQPAPQQQPPVIIQQPAPATQQAPIIVNPPAASGGATVATTDDSGIQAEIDKRIGEDTAISGLGITTTVLDGKVTLIGTVKTEALKSHIERLVRRIKGVKEIDNQIVVISG